MWTQDDPLAYFKGKGKGKRAHTSGKELADAATLATAMETS